MNATIGPASQSVLSADPHVLGFLKYLSTIQLPGVQLGYDEPDGNLRFIDCSFIPFAELKSYFQDREKLILLLQGVYGQNEPAVNEGTIYSSCLRLFCILIKIGRGDFIEEFIENGITDAQLPFKIWPPELEHLSEYPDGFWRAFNKAQWRFCPHHFDRNNISITYSDLLIFPIASRNTIDVSHGRTITKIKVHQGYHNLRLSSGYGEEIKEDELNTFVLKSLDRTDADHLKCYDSEVRAFHKLNSNGLATARRSPPDEIIRFFGSFKQSRLYHILLEYADMGTLQDYFMKTQPPANHQEMMEFWKSMMAIAIGLSRIHQLLPKDGNIGVFQGYHQDIKLSNILVFSVDPASRYNVRFKIADLGLSNFIRGQYYVSNASGRGRPGTRTFGSPDSHQARSVSNGFYNDGQASDVWSMGCIFSVAATWAIGGWHFVEQYTQSRRHNRMERRLSDSDCFHDDKTVLKAVRDWHTFLTNEKASYDSITPELWTRLLQPAFDPVPYRITAIQYQISAQELFTVKIHKRTSRSSSTYTESTNLHGQGLELCQSPVSHSNGSTRQRQERFWRGTSIDSLEQAEPSHLHSHSHSHSTAFFSQFSQEPENFASSPSLVATGFLTAGSSMPTSLTNTGSSTANTSHALSSNGTGSGVGFNAVPDNSQKGSISTQYLTVRGHETKSSSNEVQGLGEVARGKMKSTDLMNHVDCPVHSKPKPDIDTMSRADLAAWKTATDRNEKYKVPHASLVENLNHRDYVFLLENSVSMKPFWPDCCKLFSHMAKFIEKHDKDGVELYLTNSTDHFKEKQTQVLVDKARNMASSLDASSEPSHALKRIWESHSNGIRNGKRLGLFKRKKRIALTICIFTDAVWRQGADVRIEKLLKEIVEFMDVNNCTDGHVGIQFIQFGDGEAETKQLAKLDKGLKKKFGRDIVDVEPCSGNVWKMFLGTILAAFDDDHDDEQCTCHGTNGHA